MLIDTHCHLDFPDFAEDIASYVGPCRSGRRRPDGDDLDPRCSL
jgi:hypothetical protein